MSCLEKKTAGTQKVSTRLSPDRIRPTQPRSHLPSSAQIPGWSQAVGLMGQQGGPQGMLLQGLLCQERLRGDLGRGSWTPRPLTIPPSNLRRLEDGN